MTAVNRTPGKIALLFLVASLAALSGCSLLGPDIKSKSVSSRTDVFTEVESSSEPVAGYVDLKIKASIKKDTDSGPQYPFVVNVDGQAARWEAPGRVETLPAAKSAEGGTGMKYSVERTLRLAEGRHDIFFATPEDGCSAEFQVNLRAGKAYLLEFVPLYHYNPAREHISNFHYGVYRYDILLNGKR
jgi:hypothetical protein